LVTNFWQFLATKLDLAQHSCGLQSTSLKEHII